MASPRATSKEHTKQLPRCSPVAQNQQIECAAAREIQLIDPMRPIDSYHGKLSKNDMDADSDSDSMEDYRIGLTADVIPKARRHHNLSVILTPKIVTPACVQRRLA